MMTRYLQKLLVAFAALLAFAAPAAGSAAAQDTLIAPYPDADLSRTAPAGRGEHLFNLHFLPPAGGQDEASGLGPLFNRNACSACHPKGGRGKAPGNPFEPLLTALVRLSLPGVDGNGAPLPHPGYGTQLNTRGVRGVPGEAVVELSYELTVGAYDDGEPYKLRRPSMTFKRGSHGGLEDALTSLRIGQPIVGLGLLEAIPDEELLSFADPEDADGDGISGRANRVWHHGLKETVLGRFGWKSNEPDLVHQTAAAFLGDIGITSPLFPAHDCGEAQTVCRDADGAPELSAADVTAVAAYLRALSPPAARTTASEQTGGGSVRRVGLRAVPPAANRHGPVGSRLSGWHAGDGLYRSAAARHGRGAGGRTPRFRGDGSRMADAAAVGIGLDRDAARVCRAVA